MLLQFSHEGRNYSLKFNKFNTMFILGDIAVGKSLMCQDLKDFIDYSKSLSNVCVLDIYDKNYLTTLKSHESYFKYDVFVIDNADILVTPEVNNIINSHRDKFWVMIGRRLPDCVLSADSVCKLVEKRTKCFEVDYNVI